jgi:peptidoglycan hydrolase CwlO-like protein
VQAVNLLSRMKRYPKTTATRRVAADYAKAEKAAAVRDNKRLTDRRDAARQRRAKAAAKRAEERARKANAQRQQP